MTGFLEDIVAADDPSRSMSDFLSDDVEMAKERVAAREPYLDGKLSRGVVNKRFRAGVHRELMHQQLFRPVRNRAIPGRVGGCVQKALSGHWCSPA